MAAGAKIQDTFTSIIRVVYSGCLYIMYNKTKEILWILITDVEA